MNFGENLKRLRKERKWTQTDLAEKLGISREAVSMYESGARKPSFENFIALAEIMGVTLDELSTYVHYDASNKSYTDSANS